MQPIKELLEQEKQFLTLNQKRLDYLKKEFDTIVSIMNNPYEDLDKDKQEFSDRVASLLRKNDLQALGELNPQELIGLNEKLAAVVAKNAKTLESIKQDKKEENKRLRDEEKRNQKKIDLLKRLESALPKRAKTDRETLQYRDDILSKEQRIGQDLKDYIWVNQQRIDEANTLIAQYSQFLPLLAEQKELFRFLVSKNRQAFSYTVARVTGKDRDAASLFRQLHASMQKELDLIKSLERHFKSGVEDSKLRDIIEQETKLIDLITDFSLFLRIFEIPKQRFPSHQYCTYLCDTREQLESVSQRSACIDQSKYGRMPLKVAGRILVCSSSTLKVGERYRDILSASHNAATMFPVEHVMHRHFFIHREGKEVFLLFTLSDKDAEVKRLAKDTELFDKLATESDLLFDHWFKQALPLGERFRVDLKPKEHEIIYKNFTKRWLKEEAELFRENNHTALDFVDFITDMDWISKIDRELEQKYDARESEKERVKPKDFLDELTMLNLDGFKGIVRKAKSAYVNILADASTFIRLSTPLIPLDNGIVILHRSQVLAYEKQCIKLGYRPKNVYYYFSPDLATGVASCYTDCRANLFTKQLPKTRFLKMFALPSYRKIESLAIES